MTDLPNHGINVRELAVLFRELGGTITPIRGTGEERWAHPSARRPVRANARRKDASRAMVQLVREVIAALGSSPTQSLTGGQRPARAAVPMGVGAPTMSAAVNL
jgi:hypothetical protein